MAAGQVTLQHQGYEPSGEKYFIKYIGLLNFQKTKILL
jgi:hypothetical protein